MDNENETKIAVSFGNTVKNLDKLKEYEERLKNIYGFISGLKKTDSKEILNALNKNAENVSKEVKDIEKNAKNTSKTLKNMFNLSILEKYEKSLYKLAKTMFQLSQKSTEYIENVNLLEVAYKNQNESIEQSSERIEKYIEKMSKVYGLDESRLTRQFGIFKQLANAMQLPTETAENLSEIMVKMTNDIASLYNLPLDRASNALQSALAGQVRPIRGATGADITEKTLQNTVTDLGLDRSISQLSYVEKRLIMVISLTNQLKVSQGDYARTIESTSNQIRVMKEQWDRLSRAVGNVFYPILEKILPYMNAILMALTEIFNMIASLVGFKMPEFDYSGLTGVSDIAMDIEDELTGAGEATDALANKLKGLRSFDKLNVINTPSASSSSGVSGGGSGYVDPTIMEAFNKAFSEYDDKLESVRMKASKIKDDIMHWLGFEKEINEETGKIEWKYQGINKTFSNIWKSIKTANPFVKVFVGYLGIMAGIKIVSGIKNLITMFSNLTEKLGVGGLVGVLIGTGGVIIGLDLTSDAMKKVNKDGLNLINTIELLGGIMLTSLGGAMIGSIFGPWGAIAGFTVGAIGSIITAMENYQTESEKTLNTATKYLDQIKEKGKEIKEEIAETEMEIASDMSLPNFHKKLLDELDTILDANGRIKSGYEDRVKYILNELSEAYGVEYQIIDGIVQESDKLKKQIEERIRLKKAEILLEAYKEDYINAVKKEKELLVDINDAENKRNIALNNANFALEEYGLTMNDVVKITDKLKKGQKLTTEEAKKYNTMISKLDGSTINLINTYGEYEQAVTDARENYTNNSEIIRRYSDLDTAVLTGNIEEVNKELDKYTKTYIKDGQIIVDTNQQTMSDIVEANRYNLQNWKTNNKEMYKDYKNNLVNMSKTVEDITPEITGKWMALGETSKEDFIKEFSKLEPEIQKDIISKMYASGKSIGDELQRGLNAFEISKQVKIEVDNQNLKNTLYKLADKTKNIAPSISSKYYEIASQLAGGGMPQVGQIFIANERGAELVGHIGGQTFVANQNQMMDLLDKKIGNAQSSKPQVFNFYLDADHKIGTYTLDQLQDLAKTNGNTITIG